MEEPQEFGRDVREYQRVIMGIDPGTNVMGYAVIGIRGRQPEVIVMGVLELGKLGGHYKRLARIHERVTSLAAQYLPDEVALEAPFFGKNVQSMLKLGRAQGVAMAAVLARDIPIAEYPPLTVKQSVTGSGAASKERVAEMLRHLLGIPASKMPRLLDATDALAVAMTHFYESSKPAVAKGPKSWAEFLKKNPERLAPRRSAPDDVSGKE